MSKKYLEEIEKSYDFEEVIEEASRCLLCLDAPCSKDCPAGTNPGSFIRSARFHNFKGGAETIRTNNIMGGICARVCPTERYCQLNCPRAEMDEAIDIGKIQQFLTDYEERSGMQILEPGQANGLHIAIVGSGPGGLQAAASLALLGYAVTIYEKDKKLGGQLRYGIPEYRLPNAVVDHEIKKVTNLGVKTILNTEIGKNITLEELKETYDAIILAPGFSLGKDLDIYKSHPHVQIALDFLKEAKSNHENVVVEDNVLVVGGGDVAMDTCASLKLLGAKNVTCAIYELDHEIRASKKEISLVRDLGVTLLYGYVANSVQGKEVTLKHRQLDNEVKLKPNKVILAVGQKAHLHGLNIDESIINQKNLQSKDPQIFITGDLGEGEKTVVYAVRNGKFVAHAVHEYLQGGK